MKRRTPLAFLQIRYHPGGSWVSIAGISFAVLLMCLQFGIRDALYASAVRLHRSIRGDLVLMSSRWSSLSNMPRFSIGYLEEARAIPGVAWAHPLYIDAVPWRNPVTGVPRLIYIYAYNPADRLLAIPGLGREAGRMSLPWVVLFDRLSRPEFGPVASRFSEGRPVAALISEDRRGFDPRVEVGGLFSLGPNFIVDGNLITSDLNFERITHISPDLVTVGVLGVQPDVRPRAVAERINRGLPPAVQALTIPDFIALEKNFWARHTAIGYTFDSGLLMAFLIGVVFVYQVVHGLVQDHLSEYAILKTLGYGNLFLAGTIFESALLVCLAGLAAGLVLDLLIVFPARAATHLAIELTSNQILPVIAATLSMAAIGTLLALRKLVSVDPVEVLL